MMGVTISFGGLVIAGAGNQLALSSNSASIGAALQQNTAGVQLNLIYSSMAPSGSCPYYQGFQEGTALTIALFDYGSAGITPSGFVINSTVYTGTFSAASPGTLVQYAVSLGSCAHSAGQTIVVFDSMGDEIQVGT